MLNKPRGDDAVCEVFQCTVEKRILKEVIWEGL